MMKNRTKLIFIRIPGAKKAVKKSKGDFSKELNDAMKVQLKNTGFVAFQLFFCAFLCLHAFLIMCRVPV